MSTPIGLNVVKLLSGRVIAQMLGFLTMPILTRLFLPEHFGMIQIFDSIWMIITPIACLKYELSIPLARDNNEALASLVLSVLITVTVTLLTLAIVATGRRSVAAWFNAVELQKLLWFLPVIVGAVGLRNAFGYWASREEAFGAIAWSELSNAAINKLLAILWGVFIGVSVKGLFVGELCGVGVSLVVLLRLLKRKLVAQASNIRLSVASLWMVAQRHKKFPIFSTWGVFLNAISVQLPSLLLGAYFSPAVVGYYSLGYRIISFPMTVLRNSIAQVFFPAAAKEYHETGSLANVTIRFFTRLVQINVFPMVVVSLFGPSLFHVVFGQQWTEAGEYAQILSGWLVIAFINSPLQVFDIVNRQEAGFVMNIVIIAGRTIGLLIGVTFGTPKVALSIFVAISVCCLLGSTVWKLKVARVPLLRPFQTIGQYLAISCLLLFPVKLLLWAVDDVGYVLGALGVATLLYGVILLKIDRSFRQFIRMMLARIGVNW